MADRNRIEAIKEMAKKEIVRIYQEMKNLEETEQLHIAAKQMELNSFIEGVNRTAIFALGVDAYDEIREFILDLIGDLDEEM